MINLKSRLKNLWVLSAQVSVENETPDTPVLHIKSQNYIKTGAPAQFIPYEKVSPIKKITEDNA